MDTDGQKRLFGCPANIDRGQVICVIVGETNVTADAALKVDEDEASRYVAYVKEQTGKPVKELEISDAGNGEVNLRYELQTEKFERIRRITGYLVGTIDRWNDAKRYEEHERVKHAG